MVFIFKAHCTGDLSDQVIGGYKQAAGLPDPIPQKVSMQRLSRPSFYESI